MNNIELQMMKREAQTLRSAQLRTQVAADPVMATPLAVAAGVTAVSAAFTAGITIGLAAG